MTTAIRPILASSCARAATAEEARFRIDRPIPGRRAFVVALDDAAAELVDRVAERQWQGACFVDATREAVAAEDLQDVDVVVMIGTTDLDGAAAAAIADASGDRGIMTAGLILGDRADVADAVRALRPHARNLMVTDDEDDIAEVLTALRA